MMTDRRTATYWHHHGRVCRENRYLFIVIQLHPKAHEGCFGSNNSLCWRLNHPTAPKAQYGCSVRVFRLGRKHDEPTSRVQYTVPHDTKVKPSNRTRGLMKDVWCKYDDSAENDGPRTSVMLTNRRTAASWQHHGRVCRETSNRFSITFQVK